MCPEKDEYCVDVLNSTTTFFRCVKTTRCGCLAGINAKCDCRSTCLNNKCQPVPDTDPSVMPACLTDGGGFCGVANNESSLVMCASDQVCESNKCVSPSKCPVRGQCYGCEHAGIRSYYDGCNTCSCPTDNQQTMCTEQVCEPVTIVPKECDGQCNGFLTEDDGVCGRCTCNQGQKTECTKGETNECKAHLASASSTSVSVGLVVAISIATIIWN
jgi:hypothetical protein